MEQSLFCVDLPLFARLYRACEEGDLAAAKRWTSYLLACQETRELQEEERNRGAAFTRLIKSWEPDCPPSGSRCLCKASSSGMAWLGVRWRISAHELALSLGYSWIESAVMAGVKLVPFGQQAAQQMIIELSDHFAAGFEQAFYVTMRHWARRRRFPPSPLPATKHNIHGYSVPEDATWLITNIPARWRGRPEGRFGQNRAAGSALQGDARYVSSGGSDERYLHQRGSTHSDRSGRA